MCVCVHERESDTLDTLATHHVPNRMPRRQRPLCRIERPDLKNRTEVFNEMLNNYLRLRVLLSLEVVEGDIQMIRTSLYELQHSDIEPRGLFYRFLDMLSCQKNSYQGKNLTQTHQTFLVCKW